MRINIDYSDIKKLEKTLKKIKKESPKELEQLLKDTTTHIKNEAQQLAPTDSGHLKRNIRTNKKDGEFEVSSDAEYSLWVEYGTRRWAGVSFFRPAIAKGMDYMTQEIKDRFNF